MEILKIALLGIAASLLIVLVREHRPDIAMVMSVVCGVGILLLAIKNLTSATEVFKVMMDKSGIDEDILTAILKIVGIGYITEFAANVCEDSGNKSIADKIQFGGKVLILIISLPLLNAVIDIILSLMP